MDQIKIFVSSTCYDLSQIRADLFDFILNMGHQPILSEYPNFPIDPDKNTIENCITNVKEYTDIFILIIGNRYGSKVTDNISITNTEYLYAKEAGVPIFVYILKSIVTVLPIWKKNPESDFSDYVDSSAIFKFVEDVKINDKKWCFTFEKAQDITDSLKIQLSHLFHEGLKISKRFNATKLPDFWEKLSPTAIKLLIEKDESYELKFFAQTLHDELIKYEDLKRDIDYQILFESNERISDPFELQFWLKKQITTLEHYIYTCENLVNKSFKEYFGNPGVPSDLKGLYYVSCSLARLFQSMLSWSINIRSTSILDEAIRLRDSFSKYTIKSAQKIWEFPNLLKSDIEDALIKIKNGDQGPIELKTKLVLESDEEVSKLFHEEMDNIINNLK